MTPRQIELARHALGLSKHQPVSYRNRFIAYPNTPDFEDWQSMVDAGVAKRLRRAGTSTSDGGNVLFWLTRSGAEAVLRPGESLCPEDFPVQSATPSA